MGPRLLICAGESSGDQLAAELLRELHTRQPQVSAVGLGGPALRQAGMDVRIPAEELAVVGLAEVVGKLPTYLRALARVRRILQGGGVDLAVLVDFPDFNLRVASIARGLDIPVVYYVSPQVWAWRRGRLRTIARRVDHMITLLPFEADLYRAEGCPVTHAGHPLVDRVARQRESETEPQADPPLVAILPGSRPSEIRAHWPSFLDAARSVARQLPGARFEVPLAPTLDADLLAVPDDLALSVHDAPAAAVLARARCALVASGTATLEAALCGVPHAVAYRVSPATYLLGRLLVRGVGHVAMPNLVATRGGRAPVSPEFLQRLDPDAMAEPLVRWCRDDGAWRETRAQLRRVVDDLGSDGAAGRAAEAVDRVLSSPRVPPRGLSRRDLLSVAALAVGLLVVRVVLGATHPLHPDECYFWRWSLDPSWGYFDQPPAVAWLIAASRFLLGDTVASVRLPAVLCSVGALVGVYLTAREHTSHGRALAAAGLLLATPLLGVGGLVTTPDAPLSLVWVAFLYAATRSAAPGRGRTPLLDRWVLPWLGLGLLAGLGLLCKLTALLAPLGLGLWWLLRRPRTRVGPFVATACALVVVAPWLAWNASAGFAPFAWELSHGLNPQAGNPASRFAEFLGGQAGVAGPLLLVGAIALWMRALAGRLGPAGRLWTALSLPVFAVFGMASLLAPSAANWPAMAYPAVACGLAVWATRRQLLWIGGTGGALTAIAIVHLLHPLGFIPPRLDPLSDAAGYDDLALDVERALSETASQGIPTDPAIALTSRYQDAAAIAFHTRLPKLTVQDQQGRGRPNQWDLWPPPPIEPSLFVSLGPCADAPCEPIRTHEVVYRGEVVRRYVFYPCIPPTDQRSWRRPGTMLGGESGSRVHGPGAAPAP